MDRYQKSPLAKDQVVFALLLVTGLVIYFRLTTAGFINLDDNLYVYDNPFLRDGLTFNSIKWSFLAFHSANWHPITWLTHALDISLFGFDPGSHHSVNILLHLVNAILAFVVFRRMTGRMWESAMIAALFLVHPAHVESVAWISERKDVLSTLFWLLTMGVYAKWVEEDAVLWSPKYFLTLALFALGLMSKPMLVTLPFVLLLCDLWPLERIRSGKDVSKLVVEKIPLFLLSAGSSVITFIAQRASGAVETLESLPLGDRLINAILSYAKYVVMLVYPAQLAIWYPYSRDFSSLQVLASVVFLIAVTALCVWQIGKRPYLATGWFWFVGTLIPVIGIVQVGAQSLADRYTYVPYFGLFIMITFGAAELIRGYDIPRRIVAVAAGIILVAFSVVSFKQVGFWHSPESLYSRTLAVTKNNYLIAHNLCHFLAFEDRLDEAERHCRDAMEMKADYYEAYNTLGLIEAKRFNFAAAEKQFSKALELRPDYSLAYSNLAFAQSQQAKADEAELNLQRALAYGGGIPNQAFPAILGDIAATFADQKRYDKAADSYRRQLSLEPNNLRAQAKLAMVLYHRGEFDAAEKWAANVVAVDPKLPDALNALGLVSLERKRYDDALLAFGKLVAVAPDFPGAKDNLAKAQNRK